MPIKWEGDSHQHKNIEFPEINLTKGGKKKPFNEKFKAPKKEIEEGTRRWKDFQCTWISRINFEKLPINPKQSIDLMCHSANSQ